MDAKRASELYGKERQRMTLEEYEALPGDERVELLDGFVYAMSSPNQVHQELVLRISSLIMHYLDAKKSSCKVFVSPFDVYLCNNPEKPRIVQPDIFVVCDSKKLDGRRVNGAPDWVIEIVSLGNAMHDYLDKLSLYIDAGVGEYWIVNPMTKEIIAYSLKDGELLPKNWTFKDNVPVGLCEGLYIDFAALSEAVGIDL